jgi:4-amino-4-deoxy-L-arabinose transferase-like glycosyltransferase
MRRHGPLVLAAAIIALWVIVPACRNSAQWGDNFEQFVWAHSLDWGYYKHPPLPTWLMGGLIALAGPSRYWAYLLAGLCNVGTAFFTLRIAQRLLGMRLAGLALLFWGLQQAFSARAQLYNHNTVLMLMTSATAWCALRATCSESMRWWFAAGVGAGGAMLSKYQALVPLGGLLVALMLCGDLLRVEVRRGVTLAGIVALMVFAPHAIWMVRHDFTTLRYAAQEGRPLDWAGRGLSVASFLAQQVRLLLPALALALLLAWLPGLRRHDGGPHHDLQELSHWRRAWLVGLVAFPVAVTLLTCPVLGLRLQNHWGFQCLQFVALWLAWRLRAAARRPAAVLVALTLVLQGVSLAMIAGPLGPRPHETWRRDDNDFPAQRLASAVMNDWTEMTGCRLKIVVGPAFEGGIISVYGGSSPAVLEGGDFRKTPWVTAEDLARDGAVYVAHDPQHLPPAAVMIDSMKLGVQTWSRHGDRLYWAIVPPRYCTP